jgi:hypothetical protein
VSAYITYQDVLNVLQGIDFTEFPTVNSLITNVFIPQAQADISAYIGYTLEETSCTRFYSGNNCQELPLGVRPVQSVTECIIYSVPYQSEWLHFRNIAKINTIDRRGNIITADSFPTQQSDLIIDCTKGIMQIPITAATYAMIGVPINYPQFLAGTNNIKVSMVHGYNATNMPIEVKKACVYRAATLALLMKSNFVGQGVMSIGIGQANRSYGGAGSDHRKMAYSGMLSQMDTFVEQFLKPYKGIYC